MRKACGPEDGLCCATLNHALHGRCSSRLWLGLALAVLWSSACGGDAIADVDSGASRGRAQRDAGAKTDPCAEIAEGEACGNGLFCRGGDCRTAVCGDGVRIASEACDDGNLIAADGCDPACNVEQAARCGDGRVDPEEQCDDGNLFEQDACSTQCTLRRCGNQAIDFGEECDDGNTVDNDACSNACIIVRCRNGRLDPGEQCDDGNAVDMDSCTNDCKSVPCGNGKVEEYESCDDGNRVDGDGCPSNCVIATCGNGKVELGEVCENSEAIWSVAEGKGHWSDCIACNRLSAVPEAGSCLECVQKNCRAFGGVDVYAGCFEKLDVDIGAPAQDLFFLEQCTAAVNCELKHRSFGDPTLMGAGGYCGSIGIDACNTMGPALDAPCVLEWQKAARSDVNNEVHARFTDFSQPSGWAFQLLQCIVDVNLTPNCRKECAPWASQPAPQ
jgi:cysteine-rich repeat protein